MSISFTRYVDITSGILGAEAANDRVLCLRLYSTNPLIPTNSYAEFASADDVEEYFGTESSEYLRAAFYFSFISKTATSPLLISFASWVQAATAPAIYGSSTQLAPVATFAAAGSMALQIQIGASNSMITTLNFSGCASYAAIAALLQTTLRAINPPGPFANIIVVYDPVRGTINCMGTIVATGEPIPISITPVTNGVPDAGVLLGWEAADTIFSEGAIASSLTDTMITSTEASNNFGSFAFIPTLNTAQIDELAAWEETNNFDYMYLQGVTADTAGPVSAVLLGQSVPGVALTLSPIATEFPELIPGIILAATDYTKRNASQNYMYQTIPGVTPSVTTDLDANVYDAIRVNYYGQTQEAGKNISFYQRGVLTGNAQTAATDMNIYANEMWFKNHIGNLLFSLQMAVNQISNNNAGKAKLLATIQSAIEDALVNGVISPGQTLNATQQAVILDMTNDPTAYLQMQTIGYWLDIEFESVQTTDNRTECNANYTLLYTKNNAIRKINGTHGLI